MIRRICSSFVIVAALFATMGVSSASAQTIVNSSGISVHNDAPADVLFSYPVVPGSNVVNVFIGCQQSPMPNQIFVYEEQPDHSFKIYQFFNQQVDCSFQYLPDEDADDATFVGSLTHDITVTTADHTVTIKQSTAWTAAKQTGRHGYYWAATSGSSQIVVQ